MQIRIVHEMLSWSNCSGFFLDPENKIVSTEKSLWDAYIKVHNGLIEFCAVVLRCLSFVLLFFVASFATDFSYFLPLCYLLFFTTLAADFCCFRCFSCCFICCFFLLLLLLIFAVLYRDLPTGCRMFINIVCCCFICCFLLLIFFFPCFLRLFAAVAVLLASWWCFVVLLLLECLLFPVCKHICWEWLMKSLNCYSWSHASLEKELDLFWWRGFFWFLYQCVYFFNHVALWHYDR